MESSFIMEMAHINDFIERVKEADDIPVIVDKKIIDDGHLKRAYMLYSAKLDRFVWINEESAFGDMAFQIKLYEANLNDRQEFFSINQSAALKCYLLQKKIYKLENDACYSAQDLLRVQFSRIYKN